MYVPFFVEIISSHLLLYQMLNLKLKGLVLKRF